MFEYGPQRKKRAELKITIKDREKKKSNISPQLKMKLRLRCVSGKSNQSSVLLQAVVLRREKGTDERERERLRMIVVQHWPEVDLLEGRG